MKSQNNNIYFKIGLTAFGVIAVSITFFFSLFRLDSVLAVFSTLIGTLTPFTIGFVLAYLLLPIFNGIYKYSLPHFKKLRKDDAKAVGNAKILSAFGSVAFLLLLLSTLLSMVLPSLASSILGLTDSMDEYLITIQTWMAPFLADNVVLEKYVMEIYNQAANWLMSWVQDEMLPQIVLLMSGGLLSTMNLIKNLFVGLIITIYMLHGKDTFKAQAKKTVYSLFPVDTANMILHNVRFTHRVFGGFISGKLLDSLIIGIITFFALTLLDMPYVMLISVIIGVTNIIPFFGPFIGAVPAGFLVLIVDPIKCIYFIIYILVLQQFDGNILGPKILGDSTGLSSFWVMFAILVFGSMLGFVGMVIGVPLFAVLYSAISALIARRLRKRNLPDETETYLEIDHIDEQTGKIVPVEHGRAMPQSVKISRKKDEGKEKPPSKEV